MNDRNISDRLRQKSQNQPKDDTNKVNDIAASSKLVMPLEYGNPVTLYRDITGMAKEVG